MPLYQTNINSQVTNNIYEAPEAPKTETKVSHQPEVIDAAIVDTSFFTEEYSTEMIEKKLRFAFSLGTKRAVLRELRTLENMGYICLSKYKGDKERVAVLNSYQNRYTFTIDDIRKARNCH